MPILENSSLSPRLEFLSHTETGLKFLVKRKRYDMGLIHERMI